MAQPQLSEGPQLQDQQAQQQQPENQQIPRSPYPAPPPFWKHFTVQNAARLEEAESQPNFSAAALPYELAILRPPPPPEQTYTAFGISQLVTPKPTLPEDQDILLFDADKLLRPDTSTDATDTSARPHSLLLSRLTKSLLLNFLELSTIMAENPREYYEEKVTDMGILVQNVAAVINLLRPHQAREGVKIMLENRLIAGNEEVERCDEVKGRVLEFLKGVEESGNMVKKKEEDGDMMDVDVDVEDDEKTGKQGEVERARRLWAMLDDLDGD